MSLYMFTQHYRHDRVRKVSIKFSTKCLQKSMQVRFIQCLLRQFLRGLPAYLTCYGTLLYHRVVVDYSLTGAEASI